MVHSLARSLARNLYGTALILLLVITPLFSSAQMKVTPLNSPAASPTGTTNSSKNPNILFEGYSKILLSGAHVGYTVQRFEFDPKKKQFEATYLIKTEGPGYNNMESLKAFATQELKPISYQYTSLVENKSKTIDAKFNGNRMTGTLKEGKETKKLVADIPKGAFLGIFLNYVILRSPDGLKTDSKYNYKAMAEEDGKIYDGVAEVHKEEKFNGLRAFKANNTFKDVSYSFYLTDSGEDLMTDTPAANIKTILVAKPQEALANFKVPTAVLKSLFGEMPQGVTNTVSRALQAESRHQDGPPPSKREGIPPDPKIMIKGTPDKGTTGE